MKCTIETCENKVLRKLSLCYKHHMLQKIANGKTIKLCSVDGCSNYSHAHNKCSTHNRIPMPESQKKTLHHGYSLKPEYRVWLGMKQRCYNPHVIHYEDYGGRGIKVCDRWLGKYGFINFYADMGTRPSSKYQIERINNDGDYEPDNCKWATIHQQQMNKRGSSSHPGVHKIVANKYRPWGATLKLQGKYVYRESFKTLDEAIEARRAAELKYLGKIQ